MKNNLVNIVHSSMFVNKNRHIGLVLSLSVEEEVIMSPMIVILSNPILFVWTRDGRNQMMVNANCVHNIRCKIS